MKKIIITTLILIIYVIGIWMYYPYTKMDLHCWMLLGFGEAIIQILLHFILNYNKYK